MIASCRNEHDVKKLRQEGLDCVQLDLNNEQSIERGVEQAFTLAPNGLYAVFNNGAYGQPGALEDLPTQGLRDQFQTNFFGWHHLIRLVLPSMR